MNGSRARWMIVGLLFFSTVINYVDRQTLSILSPTLRREFHLSERHYANAVSAFLIAYTVMYSLSGRLLDRIGVRAGMALCIAWWSVATMLTSLARGPMSLAAFRFLLGIGEPGVFPAGLKACSEWFSPRERALPTGVFSSGSALGAVLAPPIVAWITVRYGWRYAFTIPGAVGLLWIPIWLQAYRRPPRSIGKQEPAGRSWSQMLRERKLWAVVLPRVASDPVWYFYLFWLPDYLQRERGLSLAQIGIYGWIPFLFADFGNVGGGALSDWLVRRGWPARQARIAMLVGVGCVAPFGALVGAVRSTAVAIAITCLIGFLTQCWTTNISTLAADLFPQEERGTVAGLMGTAGSLGGVLFSQALGLLIGVFGYPSAFVAAAVMHPVAATVLVLLARGGREQSGDP
jgi:ACS family hexuronate transporter-like MFS transporter